MTTARSRPRPSTTPTSGPRGLMYAAVFFIFAPIGILVALVQPQAWGWGAGVAAAIFSGINAILWANAIGGKRWWLLAVALSLPFIAPWLYFSPLQSLGVFTLGVDHSETTRRVVLAVASVVMLSIGFTLLSHYIRTAEARSARAHAELDIARQMHDAIVPAITKDTPWASIHAVSLASSEMGGDLIDLVQRPDGAIDLLLADVSGHGVGAGLVMSMLKGAARTRLLAPGSVAEVMTDLNRVIHNLVPAHVFVTAALLRSTPDGRLDFVLAGHLPIFIRRANATIERLDNDCLPMGVNPDEVITTRTATLNPGDAAVVFTDGLMEVANPHGDQLGLDRLAQALEQAKNTAPEALCRSLLETARAHGPQIDDQSVLVVTFK